jgi:Methyltransferase domain
MTFRHRLLWRMHDFSKGRGLEIGPLHNATVTRDMGDVKYVDVFSREQLLKNYADDELVPTERIPEIDFVLATDDGLLTLEEAASPGAPYDWVTASHVIEHTPDVIGWLGEIAELVADGGKLVLAVPDRRYCFDVHRPSTTVGQMLQAHMQVDRVPSVRAVYDYFRAYARVPAAQIWEGRPPSYEARRYDLGEVMEALGRAQAGEYVDSHVWTFTPDSFIQQLIELRDLGLSPWAIERLRPTRRGQLEFFVVLTRLPRDGRGTEEILAGEKGPHAQMPDWVWQRAQLDRRVERQQEQLSKLKASLKRRDRQLGRLKRELARKETELSRIHDSSRWRAGAVMTRPARAFRRLVRRR